MIKKPILAETLEDPTALNFPMLATPKLDGIRCLKVNGNAVSRKFIDIPNHYIRNWIVAHCPDGFDGEIMCPGKTFNETQSAVMREEGEPDFQYFVFDYVIDDLKRGYKDRCEDLRELMTTAKNMTKVVIVLPHVINNYETLRHYEIQAVANDYEGVMLRTPDSPYKCGRSTLNEGYLLKFKRFEDSEAIVLGFVEKETNKNEKVKDNLGNSKRSSHKANKVPAGTLGKFLVRDIKSGQEFSIGTGQGLGDVLRKEIWDNQDKYIGKTITYQFQPSGMKELPRFPSFKGFRDERDMSEG